MPRNDCWQGWPWGVAGDLGFRFPTALAEVMPCLGCTDSSANAEHPLSFWVSGVWAPAEQRMLAGLAASINSGHQVSEGPPW